MHVLGEFEHLNSIFKTENKTIAICNSEGKVIDPAFPKTSPDFIFVHGTLRSGAFASINYRSVKGKTVSGAGLHWTITGSEGEIEVSAPEFPWQYGMPGSKILLRVGEEKVEEVDIKDPKEELYVSSLNVPSANPARVYEAFANGERGRFASFDDAVETHRVLDAIKKGSL